MASSIVTLPVWTWSVADPVAVTVASAPVILKLSPLGDGDGAARASRARRVPPPEAPEAEMVAASATSATTRFKPAVSLQLCSWRYHCRLLDGHWCSASIDIDWPGLPPRGELRRAAAGWGGTSHPTVTWLSRPAASRAARRGARAGSRGRGGSG